MKTKKKQNFSSTFSKSGKSKKTKKKQKFCSSLHKTFSKKEIPLVEYSNFENDINISKNNSQLVKTNKQFKKKFVKTLLTPYSNTIFLPENDFYRYINNLWLEKTNLTKHQQYLTQIDNFRIVQENVYKQVQEIILDYTKNNNNKLSKELRNFYVSAINFNPISSSKKIAKDVTEYVDNLRKDKKNLWKLMGNINRNHIVNSYAIFKWMLRPDKKEPGVFRIYLLTHQFPLVNLSILNGDKNDPVIKKELKQKDIYLKSIFNTILGPNNNINIDNLLKVETKLLRAKDCNIVTKGNDEYNRVTRKDAIENYGFNWDEYSKEIGFETPPEFFIIDNLNYLKCVMKLLHEEWNSEEWRPFWLLMYYRVIIRFTNKWRDIYFNYYGKFQKGLKGSWYKNDAVKSVLLCTYPFGHFLSKMYTLKYNNPKNIEFVKMLAEDLRLVFIRILKRNSWLSPKTKNYAIENTHFNINNLLHKITNIAAIEPANTSSSITPSGFFISLSTNNIGYGLNISNILKNTNNKNKLKISRGIFKSAKLPYNFIPSIRTIPIIPHPIK